MSRQTTYPVAMTLRLESEMAGEIDSIAQILNLSRSALIRRSIRRAIRHARKTELPLLDARVRKAIEP
jgi:predicted transcriptional regulator